MGDHYGSANGTRPGSWNLEASLTLQIHKLRDLQQRLRCRRKRNLRINEGEPGPLPKNRQSLSGRISALAVRHTRSGERCTG